jgi:probable rRNA maturation factor
MAIEVYVADEQSEWPIDVERWSTLGRKVLKNRGVKGPAEVSLLFMDESSIAALNGRYLGQHRPTDVLAFPIEAGPPPPGDPELNGAPQPMSDREGMPRLIGDVVVCPAVAARNAVDHDVAVEDELALLVVHGLLHLLGMDHVSDADGEKMERRERKLLRKYHRPAVSDGKVRTGPSNRKAGGRKQHSKKVKKGHGPQTGWLR